MLYAVLYEGDIVALQRAQSEGKILKFLPIEIGSAAGVSERITTWKALPSPRVIPTHVPFQLYPQTVLERHCKRVYVVRTIPRMSRSLFIITTVLTKSWVSIKAPGTTFSSVSSMAM